MEQIKLPQNWECVKQDDLTLYINTKDDLISYLPPMHFKEISQFINIFKINKEKMNKLINSLNINLNKQKENQEHVVKERPIDKVNIAENKVNGNLLGHKRARETDNQLPDEILNLQIINERIVLEHINALGSYNPLSVKIKLTISYLTVIRIKQTHGLKKKAKKFLVVLNQLL
jgi:hypothetical protein